MHEFLEIALSFPTVLFSGLLVCVVLYWLMVIAGAIDIDMLDLDVDLDTDVDVDVGMDVDADLDLDIDAPEADVDGDFDVDADAAGSGLVDSMLAALGLGTVPVTIIASILTLVAWFLCFAAVYYLGAALGGGAFVGVAMAVASVVAGLPITSMFTHPLKDVFETHTATAGQTLVGKVCRVTTGTVSETFGQATVDDGGAGLVVSIRCDDQDALDHRSQALIIDYDADRDVYLVDPYDDLMAAADADVVLDATHDKASETHTQQQASEN